MSVTEKRVLAKLPQFSLETVWNGSFEKQTENYLADHFPFRKQFVSLEAHAQLYTGNNGAKGVYAGKDGYLIPVPVKQDLKKIAANREAIYHFAKDLDIPCTMMIVPSAGSILSDKLPYNHDAYQDEEVIQTEFEAYLNPVLTMVPLSDTLKDAEKPVFYKTDHHWTSFGAYLAYCVYMASFGQNPLPESVFSVTSYPGFYGTGYAKSGLWEMPPDTLEIYFPPADAQTEIIDSAYKESRKQDSMFFKEHLETEDMYSVFLDGNHSLVRIVNPKAEMGKLLVLKDSYAHCLVPFLAQHFSQIDMVDLRYYTDSVSELEQQQNYDRVLMLYGISTLCESNDLVRLR